MKAIHRIRDIIDHYNLSVSAFEKSIDLSNNSIQIALKRKASVKDTVLNKILETYPDINPVWLLTGKGDMLEGVSLEVENVRVFFQAATALIRAIDALEIAAENLENQKITKS